MVRSFFRVLFKAENYRGYVVQTVETPAQALKLVSYLVSNGYSPEILYSNSDGSGKLRFLSVKDLEGMMFTANEESGAGFPAKLADLSAKLGDSSPKLYKQRTSGGT